MDDLLNYCLRELAFDGDLGCNVSRLHDFVEDFYVSQPHKQLLDDNFMALVWFVVVQQPTVRIGIRPLGLTSEVYVPPQASAKRKAKVKGEELPEPDAPSLTIIDNAKERSLQDLRAQFGDSLRIAVDPDTVFAAITGSHIRTSKLSPMVYASLQLITRKRDQGLSVIDLSQLSGYDPKACFYLVKQLTDLNLVVKVRQGGVGLNFCIHKYFFDRSASWQEIRNEEFRAENENQIAETQVDEDLTAEGQSIVPLEFPPIDARHLSSLPLVRARLTKLLKMCKNYMHASNNILIALGFSNPNKTDRRFFQTRLRELVAQGIVEKVVVPSNSKKSRNASTKCLRLLATEPSTQEQLHVTIDDLDDDDKEFNESDNVQINMSIHKQINTLLENAGTQGMTLNSISTALRDFDKRTVELLLTRDEKNPPPPHIGDLGISSLLETYGRERRNRYMTIASFNQLMQKQSPDDLNLAARNDDHHGLRGFALMDPKMFYSDDAALINHQDNCKDDLVKKHNPNKRPQGRPRKRPLELNELEQPVSKKRKTTETDSTGDDFSNPLLQSQVKKKSKKSDEPPKKRGRPRKVLPEQSQDAAQKTEHEGNGTTAPPKKTTRKLKSRLNEVSSAQTPAAAGNDNTVNELESTSDIIPSDSRSEPFEVTVVDRVQFEQVSDFAASDQHHQQQSEQGPDVISGRPRRKSQINKAKKDVAESSALSKPRRSRKPRLEQIGHGEQSPDGTGSQPEVVNPIMLGRASFSTPMGPPRESTSQNQLSKEPDAVLGMLSLAGNSSVIPEHTPSELTDEVSLGSGSGSTLQSTLRVHELEQQGITSQHTLDDPRHGTDPSHGGGEMRKERPVNSNPSIQEVPSPARSSLFSAANVSHISQPTAPASSQPETNHDAVTFSREGANTESKQNSRARINLAQKRREAEFWQVLLNSGGIVNTNVKEFIDGHVAVVQALHQAGEPTSLTPSGRVDKRTVNATFNSMESQGKVKIIRTSFVTHTGTSRPACVVYRSDLNQRKVDEYLVELARESRANKIPVGSFTKISEPLEYGTVSAPMAKITPSILQVAGSSLSINDAERAKQLFDRSDQVIRDALLTERTTAGQLYGFIVAQALRARQLHLQVLLAFDRRVGVHVVSAEARVLDISFCQNELSLAAFCSLVSTLATSDELSTLMSTDEGRATPVSLLSESLRSFLGVGRARARSRMLETLETLRSLNLATPLRPTTSSTPYLVCNSRSGHSTTFEIASLEGWTSSTPMAAPIHWQFHTTGPLHWWAASQAHPPFMKNVSLASYSEGVEYWKELEHFCLDSPTDGYIWNDDTSSVVIKPSSKVTRFLQWPSSWSQKYVLTWHQRQYLLKFMDPKSGHTPLESHDRDASELQRICWVASIPQDVVIDFYRSTQSQLQVHAKNLRRQKKLRPKDLEVQLQSQLAKRAAEANLQREKDWQNLAIRICAVSPTESAAIRLQRVRAQYLVSAVANDEQRWADEIRRTIREAESATSSLTRLPNSRPVAKRYKPTQEVLTSSSAFIAYNPPEKSVQSLIEQQRQLISAQPAFDRAKPKPRKRKRAGDRQDTPTLNDSKQQFRRTRFQWNRDYEELARDAYAIIKSRCRNYTRLDFTALEQVFPAIPRNSVRQHLNQMKESYGNETYMKRLEDSWYEFWTRHKGTEMLPDPQPDSVSDFDLPLHVEILRLYIDKNALRVGFHQSQEATHSILPATVEDLTAEYDVDESCPQNPAWDFMWSAAKDEGRETALLKQAFTLRNEAEEYLGMEQSSDAGQLTESGLKMVMGTQKEVYDSQLASELLHDLGDNIVEAATKNLLSRNILSKLIRDPNRPAPGRLFKINEVNMNALGGSVHQDIFQDAAALEETSSEQDDQWREWPLVASDGDIAALLQLASGDKANFRVDISCSHNARLSLDWNSKKSDDDDLESSVYVCFDALAPETSTLEMFNISPLLPMQMLDKDYTSALQAHGKTIDNAEACCSQLSATFVDCAACLEGAKRSIFSSLGDADTQLSQQVLSMLVGAGGDGITEERLCLTLPSPKLRDILELLSDGPTPLVYWVGYQNVVLIHASFLRRWTVLLQSTPQVRVFPRRWINMRGSRIADIWNAALRAVLGIILFRPGISHAELRWRLRAVYDRQELADAVRFLVRENLIESRLTLSVQPGYVMSDSEEKCVFWFLCQYRQWYQVVAIR